MSNNTIYIDASRVSNTGETGAIAVLSDADDAKRSFGAISSNAMFELFFVEFPDAKAAMIFVSRTHVNKDTIALRAADTGRYACSTSETNDNTMASSAGGGACRAHLANDSEMFIDSYLGTVFNNTDTANKARGTMGCEITLAHSLGGGTFQSITDTTTFTSEKSARCYMASVNNGLGTTVKINDTWVDDAASTTEVELYAIGIDVSDKTFPEFSDAAGYGRTEFIKAHDNAAFKKLLKKNKWGELRFKVKIVKKAVFDAL